MTIPEPSISERIANWASTLTFEDLPDEVVQRSKLFALDCIGIAFASTQFDFSRSALAALTSLDAGGNHPVVGLRGRLGLRDATVMNGILMHGLDYDDTHVGAVCHASTSALPLSLGLSAHRHLTGRDLLLGYVVAVEVSARIGMAANGGFHEIGFHPTGVAGAFGCATAAAKLDGQPAVGIATAQGFVGSMAAGLLEFLDDGSWTKRAHPGLAASAGLTAAAFSRQNWQSPAKVYEGRFGLYRTHIQTREVDLDQCTANLGTTWEVLANAVKPFPACHFIHAFADAAMILAKGHGLAARDIESITAYIHPTPGAVVCEPAENKLRPKSDYDAKFSLPFVVAASIVRGTFGLRELEPASLNDPEILALAQKVRALPDPESGFPKVYSGAITIRTTDAREFHHREQVNRGADERPLSAAEIVTKFHENMGTATSTTTATRIEHLVLDIESVGDAWTLAEALSG